MATRHALRLVQRRFSSGGKVHSEGEKAAENVIKIMEQEKSEKLARKGPKGVETSAPSKGGSISVPYAKPSKSRSTSTSRGSNDEHSNFQYAAGKKFAAGMFTSVCVFEALEAYFETGDKKTEQVRD